MVSWEQHAIRPATVHVRQFGFHGGWREHGYFLEAEGRKDVLLKVVIQRLLSYAFEAESGPVYVDLGRMSVLLCGLVELGREALRIASLLPADERVAEPRP